MLWLFVMLALILLWVIPAFRTLQEMEGQPAPRWRIPFLHLIDEPEEAAIVFVLLGIGIAVGGYAFLYGLGTLRDIVGDFYANIAAEAISIAITVLIIERLYERRSKAEAEKAEKERLILQMGSPDNGFAVEAIRQLKHKGWLNDGSLRAADLCGANLCTTNLVGSDMREVKLLGANLCQATLWNVNLSNADLRNANLSNATAELVGVNMNHTGLNINLSGAKLTVADLSGARLSGANLSDAELISTNLSNVNLMAANLTNVNLTGGASHFGGEFQMLRRDRQIPNRDLAIPPERGRVILPLN